MKILIFTVLAVAFVLGCVYPFAPESDSQVTKAGDNCLLDGLMKCGVGQALYCKDGHFVFAGDCRTCSHVKDDETQVSCTTGSGRTPFAIGGVRCAVENAGACTFDLSADLECTGGAWTIHETCAPPTSCGFKPSGNLGCK